MWDFEGIWKREEGKLCGTVSVCQYGSRHRIHYFLFLLLSHLKAKNIFTYVTIKSDKLEIHHLEVTVTLVVHILVYREVQLEDENNSVVLYCI